MKKIVTLLLSLAAMSLLFVGCSGKKTNAKAEFETSKKIAVGSREDGSGTRGAFIELFVIEEKTADGQKIDHTTKSAVIANQTGVMLSNVENDPYAIGYVSLGSLNDSVNALKIDGKEATSANVKDGSYKIARPFNIATKGKVSPLAQDFINFILSKEGQQVIAKDYISIDDKAKDYSNKDQKGKLTIAGSSSVTPVMQKIKEAYITLNPEANIEIQESDSSAGMTAAMDGTCDIGMASRELKDEEKSKLKATAIALDGIAVIVNAKNPLKNLTSKQVAKIYTGKATAWSDFID